MGSAGSSKSYFITQKLILRAVNEPIRILVCRRYGTTIRNTCFSLFKDIISKWKLTNYCKVNESDFRIRFLHNGSEIIFTGLDDETKLLSLNNIGSIFIEEAYEVPKNIVEQLNLRMRGNTPNQQILMAWNPISKHSWLYDFTVENPPQNSIFIHSTYKDNPFLKQEYIDALEEMRERNPAKYKVYGLGEWGTNTEALVFNNWKIEEFDNTAVKGELICGMDFGFVNDLTTLVCSLLDQENKKIYIFQEWGDKGKTNSEIAQVITSLGFSKSVIIADCSEPKSIEELRRNGIRRVEPCSKGKDSIIHGIDQLKEYEIIVNPQCIGIITEFENYQWKPDKDNAGEYLNVPIDKFNHYIDALRYSLQVISKNRKLQSIDKTTLGL